MGVRVDPVNEPVKAELAKLSGAVAAHGKVTAGAAGYVIDGRLNDAFKAVNMLLAKDIAIRRADKAGDGLHPGDFLVGRGNESVIASVAHETGVDFSPLRAEPAPNAVHDVKKLRVAMYQRYSGGNIDEGWTRWLIEDFKFPYTSVMDAEIKKGNLNGKYDVLILPEDSTATLTGERPAGGRGGGGEEGGGFGSGNYPPEYRSGFGTEGVNALRDFVQKGGTIVTLGAASNFAMERLGVSVRNVIAGKSTKEFWCPGSTLKMKFDNMNPMAYGMPAEGLGVYLQGSPVFQIVPTEHNERYEVVATYADRDILQSGWLVGEQMIAKQAGMVVAHQGQGRVVLIGFRTQHRAQTYGTFKLLFNALIG